MLSHILLTDKIESIIPNADNYINSIFVTNDDKECSKCSYNINVITDIYFKEHEMDIVLPYYELLKKSNVYNFDNYKPELTDNDWEIIRSYNIRFPFEFSGLYIFEEYRLDFENSKLELLTKLMLTLYGKVWSE